MYYLVTEYELPIGNQKLERKLITIGNKSGFTDMYDYHPLCVENQTLIISEKSLKDFLKDGFSTKDEARKARELKDAIISFVGPFYNGIFKVLSEDELLTKYKTLT